MKKVRAVSLMAMIVALGLAVGSGFLLRGQTEDLQPLPPGSIPEYGTFWSLQNSDWPPLPFVPFPELPVYALEDGSFLYDDRSVDYGALNAPEQMSQTEGGFELMVMEDGELGLEGYSFSSEELWLELGSLDASNHTASFVVHPPTFEETNGVYDLYMTTNLGIESPGLNATNWLWLLGTSPGETNLTVSNLTAEACFFLLGRTNDTDGDFLTDPFERLCSHTDPANGDENTNSIPDGWEWAYFGDLNQAADGDYDGDGVTNLSEYVGNSDPNKIRFSIVLTNEFVNSTSIPVQLAIVGGVPSSVAVLRNSTNFAEAVWLPFTSPDIVASIGPGDGDYAVWIGLRGRLETSEQSWEGSAITLDTVPPALAVTNPTTATVTRPIIQLQGHVNELLASLTYDLTNAGGLATNREGFIIGKHVDTNTWKFTTNWFQCYDIDLISGDNTITLCATDLAGNMTSTNFTFTLDYAGVTNGPLITITWPLSNSPIGGTNFTLSGIVDDDTASVLVSNETFGTVKALVERGGNFSAPDLPLSAATNVFTIISSNAAGQSSTAYAAAVPSPHTVTLNPILPGHVSQSTLTLSGTVVTTGQNLWVNGAPATVDGNNWTINIPAPTEGTAGLLVQIGPNLLNIVAEQRFVVSLPSHVYVSSYLEYYFNHEDGHGTCLNFEDSAIRRRAWELNAGGKSWVATINLGRSCVAFSSWPTNWPDGQTLTAFEICYDPNFEYGPYPDVVQVPFQYCRQSKASSRPFVSEGGSSACVGRPIYHTASRRTGTEVSLRAVGPADSERQRLVRLTVSAAGYAYPVHNANPPALDTYGSPGEIPIPPAAIEILGHPLMPTATNAWVGETYLALPSGSTRDITPSIVPEQRSIHNNHSFDVQAEDVTTLLSLAVVSNSATGVAVGHWATVKTLSQDDFVIIEAILSRSDTNAAGNITWTGGEAVQDNPLQRRIAKSTSARVTVTATTSFTNLSADIWILWGSLTFLTSGVNPSNAPPHPPVGDDDSQTLGVRYGTSDSGNFQFARGRITEVAAITPAGVHLVITNGWHILRYTMGHDIADGVVTTNEYQFFETDWRLDGPSKQTTSPDTEDKLYSIDAPVVAPFPGSQDSSERYNNFFTFFTWNDQVCCETNNFWRWQGRWKANQSPQITFADLGIGLIVLPTNSFYPAP